MNGGYCPGAKTRRSKRNRVTVVRATFRLTLPRTYGQRNDGRFERSPFQPKPSHARAKVTETANWLCDGVDGFLFLFFETGPWWEGNALVPGKKMAYHSGGNRPAYRFGGTWTDRKRVRL